MANRHYAPGLKETIRAKVAQGTPQIQVAREFELDPQTVRRWANSVHGINAELAVQLRAALPNLATVLATAHGLRALERVESDPDGAVKSTFGMKLATETARLATPQADQPGRQVLAFIEQVVVEAPRAPVVEITATDEPCDTV